MESLPLKSWDKLYVDVHKIVTIFSFPVGRKHVIISQELNQRFRFNREKAA